MCPRARRGNSDIVAQILETARGGAIKTHIKYKAKLSSAQIEGYLTLLIEKGLLQKRVTLKDKRTYNIFETSTQGEKYLRNYRTLGLYLRA